ncbi:transcriptional regulator, TetR family [Streptomyces zhaozhouensis]|uniref:Transcriptional regulator, TetR family n=1 Tax=Streptomyces zhaozhouensis TaxID=1300267 RepID=A0A286DUT5_9ACTN|nr:TetR/AcrR family transcriptional regulator [Streptomyces zhaozhouensis]SOD62426.1 transcriptional regulator, TetR family [Streptomyces zhaozhouensis]
MTAKSAGERSPKGLRERRRRDVQDRLLHTGLELFLTQGYEATTVNGIARRAEVSERTFFRHLASKEDVILEPLRAMHVVFRQELARRPVNEPPLMSLRRTVSSALRSAPRRERHLALRALRVMGRDETARWVGVRLALEQHGRVAEAIRSQRGLPVDDPRPGLLTGAFGSATLQAASRWSRDPHGTARSLERVGESHYALLNTALGSDWSTPLSTDGPPDAEHQRKPRPAS